MMVGLPGAGKSFFARQFAESFNAPLVSADHLRTAIFSNPTHTKEEDVLIDTIMLQQTRELLKTNRSIVVDGSCNVRANRQDLQRLAKQKNYNTLIIWVQTDGPTCRQRALKRNPSREGDILNAPLTNETFDAQVKRFTPPHTTEAAIVISGKHTYSTQLRVVLKRLAPRDDQPATAPQPQNTIQQRPHGDIQTKSHRVTIN